MKAVARVAGGAIAIAVFVVAFMAYFMGSVDPATGTVYDGLGRVLTEPPWWARMIFGADRSWAGLGWHVVDFVWFFGGLGVAFAVYAWGDES